MLQKKSLKIIPYLKVFLFLPIMIMSFLFFSTTICAQKNNSKNIFEQVPYSLNGVSIKDSQEFVQIIHTYLAKIKGIKVTPLKDVFSEGDKKKLESIYFTMTKDQQIKQIIGFRKSIKPLSKIIPTSQQIDEWKNTNKYGLWIDNKHQTNNIVLSKYKNTDFNQVSISKLEDNAKSHGLNNNKEYQIDLMTKDFYRKYYNESIANKDAYIIFFRNYTAKPM